MNRFALSPLRIAWIVLVIVLLAGVPIFLRMPVWVDVTYHDISAWNILHGGTHYRDVFETNLPGMVWVHAGLRPLIGWGHESIRLADLVVFASIVLLITSLLRHREVTPQGQVWFAVAATLFYLFETEYVHCQRDGWMLLPALAATCFRLRRTESPRPIMSIAEGLLWGCAVWIKPHALVPAMFVWLASLRFQQRREAMNDTAALLVGGVVAGLAGVGWLVYSGTWPHLKDVLFNWNGEYYDWSREYILFKVRILTTYFTPFSLLHIVAIPLAVIGLFRSSASACLLGALYLGWVGQATILQKEMDYAHSPAMILAIAVLASWRLPVGPVLIVWCLTGTLIHATMGQSKWLAELQASRPISANMGIPKHPMADPKRLALWPQCWTDPSWPLKDQLKFHGESFCSPNWTDLHRVAQYLRSANVGDRDLICWNDTTHPLYVWLGVRPGYRFPHVGTALKFRSKYDVLRREVHDSPAHYVVSDLAAEWVDSPEELPDDVLKIFPWNQPIVCRSGRYCVHLISNRRGEIAVNRPQGQQNGHRPQ